MINKFTYINPKNIGDRSHYVGSSELPTLSLFNLHLDSSPLTMWMEKTGKKESFQGNERTKMGNELEALILKLGLEELNGDKPFILHWYLNKIKGGNYCKYNLFNNTHFVMNGKPYNVSHPDLLDLNNNCIHEAKSTGVYAVKRSFKKSIRGFIRTGYDKDDLTESGIPDSVYLQVQDQLLLSNACYAYVDVFCDNEFKQYGPIEPNKKVQEVCESLKDSFWECIKTDTPPNPETWADIKWINPEVDVNKQVMISGADLDNAVKIKNEYNDLSDKIKIAQSRQDEIKTELGQKAGDSKFLVDDEGNKIITIIDVKRENISLSKIKKDDTELYEKIVEGGFINETVSRQGRVAK